MQEQFERAIEMTSDQADMDSPLPAWFLDNCVKTMQDLIEGEIPLTIRENATPGHGHNRGETRSNALVYQIDPAVYEPLQRLFIPETTNTVDGQLSGSEAARCFSEDYVHLSLPRKRQTSGGSQFLAAVVDHFAKDAGADIIRLGVDDIDILANQHGLTCYPLAEIDSTIYETTGEHSARHDHTFDGGESQPMERAQHYEPTNFPLATLLSSLAVKSAKHHIQSSSSKRKPIIVHLPKVKSLLDAYAGRFVEELRGALREVTSNGLIISTSTDWSNAMNEEDFVRNESGYAFLNCILENDEPKGHRVSWLSNAETLQTIGLDPKIHLIRMVPINSLSQRLLFDKHRKLEHSDEHENIRLLQNSIRQLPIDLHKSSIIQPYADWSFLKGTPAQDKLVKHVLDQDEVDEMFRGLRHEPTVGHAGDRDTGNSQVTDAKIKEAILAFGCRAKALDEWCDNAEDESRWSTFPSQAQTTIREIENDDSLEWERRFLDCLINPEDVEEGWSAIALEPETKEAIQQLIHQPTNMSMHPYGILKRGRIAGALLYGPPGTGKTHLARALARESKSITIWASAADLESSYVGKTEKAIQGLFNLGRMLSPCTIFLDEADALFRSRKPDDRSWERSQINQLLHEMDSSKSSKSPPFILLATNFPSDLDSAVLRRVPSLIHIGLPSLEARQQIFQIYLAEEKLHPDVNLCHLAQRSQGYSGSDIQTVCVQAALICDTFIGDDARRYITNTHFDKAFQRSAPTVSKGTVAKIKAFSKEYNPAAVESMEQLDKVGRHPNMSSQLRCKEGNTTRGGDNLPPKRTKVPPIGRVEEIENHASANGVDKLESPYPYCPLQPDGMQIRVLSVLPGGNNPDGLLRCTLRTVDLNDWTTEYRGVSSGANEHGVPNLPKTRLAMWCYICSLFKGDRLYYDPGAEYAMEEGFKELWTKFQYDRFTLEGNHEIRHRFNWGDYTALSYVWGDATDRQDILLDGHRFPVTRSLYNALSHLSDAFEVNEKELHIWADAVCINQDDQEERAREVKKMGVIYSQCFSVTAWLEDPTPAIACELSSVRNFLDSMSSAGIRDMDMYSSGFGLVMDLITRLSAAHSLEVVSFGLALSPFWERLWTIQEVALPPAILFHYGKEAFTTEDMCKLCFVSFRLLRLSNDKEVDSKHRVLLGIDRAFSRLCRLRPSDDYDCLGELKFSTADSVRFTRKSESKDPRDKVFGLVALLPDSIAERIKPNYDPSFSMQDTYVMFFKSCYEAAGNLDFLARVIVQPSVTPNLPSWVLDLDSDNYKDAVQEWAPYRFHKTNLGMPEKQLTFCENDRLLFCEGVIVDAVVSLGAVEIYSGRHVRLQAEGKISKSRAAIPASNYDWKLALARVLMQDSFYEFSESLSVLDIPWPDPDVQLWTVDKPDYDLFESYRQWSSYESDTMVGTAHRRFFPGNEDFDIGGKRLQDYFTSSTDTDPAEYDKLAGGLVNRLSYQRLCMTENGLLGTAPVFARKGDKIAVLSNCDMPMVLRPNGQHYEVVGSCFVEGLMKGEVAAGIEQGLYQMEKLSLC
ncbi:MAG: hypothetical protein Q9178_002368 [Gyalolechia marmorata]